MLKQVQHDEDMVQHDQKNIQLSTPNLRLTAKNKFKLIAYHLSPITHH